MTRFLKMTTLIVLAGVTLEAHARSPEDERDACRTYYGFAEQAAMARQNGLPLPRVLEAAKGEELLEGIILDAYDIPRFNVRENQAEAVQDFANDTFNWCMKEMRKG